MSARDIRALKRDQRACADYNRLKKDARMYKTILVLILEELHTRNNDNSVVQAALEGNTEAEHFISKHPEIKKIVQDSLFWWESDEEEEEE